MIIYHHGTHFEIFHCFCDADDIVKKLLILLIFYLIVVPALYGYRDDVERIWVDLSLHKN